MPESIESRRSFLKGTMAAAVAVAVPAAAEAPKKAAAYHEYQFYDQRADPHELVNLAGRQEYRLKADELRQQLKKLIVAAGEPEPEIVPAKLYA
jgi:hypothetical protein